MPVAVAPWSLAEKPSPLKASRHLPRAAMIRPKGASLGLSRLSASSSISPPRVVELGIRTTIVRTRDGEELIVPNTIIAQSSVKNFTYRDSNFRLRLPVGVSYGSDMKLVHDTLLRVAEAFPSSNFAMFAFQ